MWKHRQAKDFFSEEKINDTKRDVISKETIKEFLNRLAMAETWLLKDLLGENYTVRAAAINVKVHERRTDSEPKAFFGDLYVIQNLKGGNVSFRLYNPKDNKFVWTIENISDLSGYVDLNCNTHVFHYRNSIYTFKFPDRRERTIFRDNMNKFIFFEKSKR